MNATTIRRWLVGEFTWRRVVRSAIEIYVILFVIGACCPYKLIFQPHTASYGKLPGLFMLETADSNRIAAVYLPVTNAAYTLLYCHGNAEDIGDLSYSSLFELYNLCGLGVVAYDYRSYGLSTGKPTEANSYADAELVFAHMTNALGIPPGRIIMYGRSLGCAMAVHLAASRPVAGLVLESPFYTAYRVVMPIPIMPMDRFRNKDKIGKVKCPVFIIHGQSDTIIKPWHGRELFELAHEPKTNWWIAKAGHNDLVEVAGSDYPERIKEFVGMVASNRAVRR